MGLTRNQVVIVAILLAGATLVVLNQTLLSPAYPSIMADLQADATTVQWLTSAYSLVEAIIIPLSAFLIGRFPTRKLFIAGVSVFALGSLMAAFSPFFGILLLGRIFQAAATGVVMPMVFTVILLIFPREKRGSAGHCVLGCRLCPCCRSFPFRLAGRIRRLALALYAGNRTGGTYRHPGHRLPQELRRIRTHFVRQAIRCPVLTGPFGSVVWLGHHHFGNQHSHPDRPYRCRCHSLDVLRTQATPPRSAAVESRRAEEPLICHRCRSGCPAPGRAGWHRRFAPHLFAKPARCICPRNRPYHAAWRCVGRHHGLLRWPPVR